MQKSYKYGIELELMIPQGNRNKFDTSINSIAGMKVDTDGSINCDDYMSGREIKTGRGVSMSTLIRLLPSIEKACDENGVSGNKTCGFHLHISNKRFKQVKVLKQLFNVWIAIEDVLQATQPMSRYNNGYSKRNLAYFALRGFPKFPNNREKLIRFCSSIDRYYNLNLSALAKHGTLEVRMHSYTYNARKIKNWSMLITSIMNYTIDGYNEADVMALFEMPISDEKTAKVWELLKLDNSVREFYNNRIFKFLYEKLATQQNAAIKLRSIKEAKQKVQRRYDAVATELNTISSQENEQTRYFQSS